MGEVSGAALARMLAREGLHITSQGLLVAAKREGWDIVKRGRIVYFTSRGQRQARAYLSGKQKLSDQEKRRRERIAKARMAYLEADTYMRTALRAYILWVMRDMERQQQAKRRRDEGRKEAS